MESLLSLLETSVRALTTLTPKTNVYCTLLLLSTLVRAALLSCNVLCSSGSAVLNLLSSVFWVILATFGLTGIRLLGAGVHCIRFLVCVCAIHIHSIRLVL